MKPFVAVLLFAMPISLAILAGKQPASNPSYSTPATVQETSPQEKIPVPDEAGIERRDFMRTKLMYSQNIFEGLTVRNFGLIKRGISDVDQLLESEHWVTIDNDEYRKLTDEFKTSLQRLKISADTNNIEATALRFYEMSNRCIDCHQHLRHANYSF